MESYKIEPQCFSVAVDIGTTTLVMSLIDPMNKEVIETYSVLNRQRIFGHNVIARIKACNEGKSQRLKEIIIEELIKGLNYLIQEHQKFFGTIKISEMVIACNTTMVHMLLGYSCKGLGTFPYQPFSLDKVELKGKDLIGENTEYDDINITILPGISAFVGGDIVAGIALCEFNKKDSINLFVDLGTNGEMAIGNKDEIIVTSTAVGPAFEGGSISCGVGSIHGAISDVTIMNHRLFYKTIERNHSNEYSKPKGICGTGAVSIIAEFLRSGIIDETGLLEDAYFGDGYVIEEEGQDLVGNHRTIKFTQKDIREIQLAKAAVRAGIEILIQTFHCNYENIDKVYLAGAFGFNLDSSKATAIGLLPRELSNKIVVIGNSAMNGAIEYLYNQEFRYNIDHIIEISSEINLSNIPEFNDLYINSMNF